jgi:Uma2 family endonuclease
MVRPRTRRDPERRVNGTAQPGAVVYPESDGKPLAETQLTGAEMVRITETLQDHFADRQDIYVWMNMFVYFEEGNPRAVVAPDVFIAIGAPKEPFRRTWKVWEEGIPPTVVFEVTSNSTRHIDVGRKREIYERMGVAEYFLYDPHTEYLRPPLRGYRMTDGRHVPIEPDADGLLFSAALGLRLALRDARLVLINPATDTALPSREETARIQAARADAEAERANAEAHRANSEAARADAEAEARRALELRLAQLEAQLRERDIQ